MSADLKGLKIGDVDYGASNKYFGEGVYEIVLNSISSGATAKGTPYIEVKFEGVNGEAESHSRLWLTAKALPYTAKTIQSLAVHNAESEAQKQAMRDYFDTKVKTAQDLYMVLEKLASNLATGWINRKRDAEPYDTRDDGTPKYGYSVSFFGYDPTDYFAKAQKAVEEKENPPAGSEKADIDLSDIPF